ncbi:pyridoxal-phosphate dependent enzyme [Candidatus Gracilibacteria bacterium]|nr:pyridoxal-phosphate dependent enzyme [Candidatus Gracilibacteria bacterium]
MNLILNVNKNFDELIDRSRKDVWRYANLLEGQKNKPFIAALQLDFTTIEKVGDWQIKREDQSATGSHKFRALTFQLNNLLEQKISRAVLSSSGNAAITASMVLPKESPLKLFVFLSKKTDLGKLAALKISKNFVPILSDRPLRMAKYTVKRFGLRDLRPSQDPLAAVGFRSLGFEIFEQDSNIKNIFSFATSFASIRGVQQAFESLVKLGALKTAPEIFAVTSGGQLTGDISPAVRHPDRLSIDKISESVDKSTRVDNIRQVDITDEEVLAAQKKFTDLDTSAEGFASLAAAEKIQPEGESLVILTGRNWPEKTVHLERFEKADNFAEVDKIIARHGTGLVGNLNPFGMLHALCSMLHESTAQKNLSRFARSTQNRGPGISVAKFQDLCFQDESRLEKSGKGGSGNCESEITKS